MNYLLFIGSKVGFEALKIMSDLNCKIVHVFIEKEHDHEHEKFYSDSVELCNKADISFTLNSSQKEISTLLAQKVNFGETMDYIMSFGYRRMISKSVIQLARIAALGTHFSPLPRYRGFAPLNWVLINGEQETAVNLFYLDDEVDNGDIIKSIPVPIEYEDDINTLFDKCVMAFQDLIVGVIPMLEKEEFEATKQDSDNATYTCARNPEDGLINWDWSANRIYNLTRALTYPYPGAYTFINGKKVFVWSCEEYKTPIYEGRVSGKVIKIIKNYGVVVLCGEGAVVLKSVQIEGEEKLTADRMINSIRLTLGN
jgi:methionyl-tRNA formyltransferase